MNNPSLYPKNFCIILRSGSEARYTGKREKKKLAQLILHSTRAVCIINVSWKQNISSDFLHCPPYHPIGTITRKIKNGTLILFIYLGGSKKKNILLTFSVTFMHCYTYQAINVMGMQDRYFFKTKHKRGQKKLLESYFCTIDFNRNTKPQQYKL